LIRGINPNNNNNSKGVEPILPMTKTKIMDPVVATSTATAVASLPR